MTVNINWATLGAIASTIAGVVGAVITPIYGSQLATAVQAVLMGLSTILVAIPSWHVASVASAKAKYNHLAKMAALRPVPVTLEDLAALHPQV
jgi:ABC-type dipeptide/oligopeptide/nickel transport system permease component